MTASPERYPVLIVGGGTAGICVAARLRQAGYDGIAIVEPSKTHYYQPAWTLVGGGVMSAAETARPEADYIPAGVRWIESSVTDIEPQSNAVVLADGRRVEYDYLVVAAGIQLNWSSVAGLEETLGKNGVSSNYSYDLAPKTWELIRNFKGGRALFTFPAGPIKCAGAPQKIMYLAADYFRKHGIKAEIIYASATPAIFGTKYYQGPLNKVVARYGITTMFQHNLVAVDGAKKEATFENLGDPDKKQITLTFDMMHVTPPQSAPDFIRSNALLAAPDGVTKGYLLVDKATMQSPNFPNLFALGDASSTPNSKTGAAIRKQAPILVANLIAQMAGQALPQRYNGYASCPLVTGYGKLILAEFDYDGNPQPSIPFIDTSKERWSMYMLKRHGLPWMYWNLMLKGKA
ncbi:MAG TPA: FAD/NAD(P)-binding oxidoreductase [Candidatus Dormibacteraeota bacterium]|nr:FAD/NAD(P)-binding oxidoreductase [Candidatus Dormibacteraeota bacterium]